MTRPTPEWRYLLADARTMTLIAHLKKAKSRAFDIDINSSGSASCNIPIDDWAMAANPWQSCLIVQRDDEWIWSGPVKTRQFDLNSGRCSLSAVGWFEFLMRRLLLEPHTFTAQDAGAIVFGLLAIANAQADTYITPGISQTSQPRTRSYAIDVNIGREIIDLSQLESGYDFYVDPTIRTLNIIQRLGNDQTGCKWIFVVDESGQGNSANNCKNVLINEDGDTVVNEIRPRGKFSSGFAEDIDSKFKFNLHMESPSLSDVVESDILNAFALGEIIYRSNPKITYTIDPKASISDNVPRFMIDFDIGDTTYLTAKRGPLEVTDQAVRIFGVGVQIDETGVDHLTRVSTRLS